MTTILVTGGAGFIGSHTLLALKAAGYAPVVIDDLSNGHADAVGDARLIKGDIRDRALLDRVFGDHDIAAVIHFAASIEAGISVREPLAFYDNNVSGSLALLSAMKDHGVGRLVFSSTAAVYGQAGNAPLREDLPKAPVNPYGQTKWAVECMIRDAATAHGLKAIALRYFNAAGADPEGRAGERHEPETHLIPLVLEVASGKRDAIRVFGTDYATPDGTCVRDYVHVADLATAHVRALQRLEAGGERPAVEAFNLGSGSGFSVRQVIEAARRVTGHPVPVIEEARRAGDPPVLVADPALAHTLLGWTPDWPALDDMIAHAWRFLQAQAKAA
ncbi:UDP-glucose 4-epimerase GalE [Gimibacter soli]|uniref:UDP-glucose 4-epimerase n=1 Tax=Gimibacter soli TaxID=3024400 RepID=A0AAE9XPY4_9PROT|nr:UDP-glucose 4-epimerase GalE [Gimibacter soli]WCL55118.1 UDP-glucose 4-epimerase GalE [Gimibacter soli]